MTPWLDDEALPAEVRELLEVGQPSRPLAGPALVRSRRQVGRLALVPIAAGVFFWMQQLALGAGLGIAVSVGVAAVEGRLLSPSTPPSALAAKERPAPTAARTASVPGIEPAQPTRVLAPEVTSAPKAGKPADRAEPSPQASASVTAEAALLEQARRAIATDPALALGILDEHARRFRGGVLFVEREVLAVDALVHASRRAEARARAARLRAQAPGSLYEDRLRKILGE